MNVESVNNGSYKIDAPLTKDALSSSDASVTLSADAIKALSGDKGTTISQDNLGKIAAGFSTTFEGTKTYYTTDGTPVHYQFTFNPTNFKSDNRTASYGDTLKASFVAKLVANAATSTTTDSSWIA